MKITRESVITLGIKFDEKLKNVTFSCNPYQGMIIKGLKSFTIFFNFDTFAFAFECDRENNRYISSFVHLGYVHGMDHNDKLDDVPNIYTWFQKEIHSFLMENEPQYRLLSVFGEESTKKVYEDKAKQFMHRLQSEKTV